MHVQHIYMMDSKGLITTKRGDKLPQHKQLMAHGDDVPVLKDLKDVIARVKPHALIGLTGGGPAWHKVRLLASLQAEGWSASWQHGRMHVAQTVLPLDAWRNDSLQQAAPPFDGLARQCLQVQALLPFMCSRLGGSPAIDT
jgi:hypothetical protein